MALFIGNPPIQIFHTTNDPIINGYNESSYTNITPNGYGIQLKGSASMNNGVENGALSLGVVNNNVYTEALNASKSGININVPATLLNSSLTCTTLTCSSEINTGSMSINGCLVFSNTTGSNIFLPTTYSIPPSSNYMGNIVYDSTIADTALVTSGGNTKTVASISLSPGVWLIIGHFTVVTPSGTNANVQSVHGGISTTSNTLDNGNKPYMLCFNANNVTFGTTQTSGFSLPSFRMVCLTQTTTYYLIVGAYFSAGSLTSQGASAELKAIRIA